MDEATFQQIQRDFDDHDQFCRESLYIRDKLGKQVSLIPQPAQTRLNEKIRECRAKRKPIRLLYLKARQVMVSTAVASEFFHQCAFIPGQKAMVVAHEVKSSENIFGYYQQMSRGYEPFHGVIDTQAVERDKDGALEWEGGGYVHVATANNLKTGRSYSLRYLHLSEFAFWRDAKTLMTGLMQAVPGDPDTIVVIESTANGVGGEFHRLWLEASDPTSGSEWIAVFFAWWEHPEYELRVDDPGAFQASLSEEEIELQQRYNLRLGQLAWRRWCIGANCQSSPEVFKQEYPSNPEEAFLFSGRPRFSLKHLAKMPIIPDAAVGELEEFYNGPKPVIAFVTKERGAMVLYKKPQQGHLYCIGVDICEGIDANETLGASDPDYSVAIVIDRANGEQVAKVRGRIEPAAFAEYCNALARYYNWAYIVPEANGPGIAFIEQLLRDNWPPALLYHRRPQPDEIFAANDSTVLSKLGWKTSPVTRVQLLSLHDQAIREFGVIIRDPHTLNEHQYFVIKANGKAEAQDGMHDDEVFALALAVVGLGTAPADRSLDQVKKPQPPKQHASGTVQPYGQRREERGTRIRL